MILLKSIFNSVSSYLLSFPFCFYIFNNTIGRLCKHLYYLHHISTTNVVIDEAITHVVPDLTVIHGPFSGMKYPSRLSYGSTLFPKLLGSYEQELHSLIFSLLNNHYDLIVDIGCAEGYYAVGFACRLQSANVFAFDINADALCFLRQMAAINNVSNKIHYGTLFNDSTFTSLPASKRSLFIIDCEGYEYNILNNNTIKHLVTHDLLIEAHDFIDLRISNHLISLFSPTHTISIIHSIDDIEKCLTYNYPELSKYDLPTKRILLAEHRQTIMRWYIMKSKCPNI